MLEDRVREEGFEISKKGLVRRLSSTHYVAKSPTAEGWQLVELREGKWTCDCGGIGNSCVHLYASLLHRSTCRLQPQPVDEEHLKCRYCGSPDIARCGFRYNSRGISRRYRCNDCQRKFSIPHLQSNPNSKPADTIWLLNEVGMLTSKLTELLSDLNEKLELAETIKRSQNGEMEAKNSF